MCGNGFIRFLDALAFAPRMLLANIADAKTDRGHRKECLKRYTDTCKRFPGPTVSHEEYDALRQAMGLAYADGEGNSRKMPVLDGSGNMAFATLAMKDPDVWALSIAAGTQRIKEWMMMPGLTGEPVRQRGGLRVIEGEKRLAIGR